MLALDAFNQALMAVKMHAEAAGDGNTCGLIERIVRDAQHVFPKYPDVVVPLMHDEEADVPEAMMNQTPLVSLTSPHPVSLEETSRVFAPIVTTQTLKSSADGDAVLVHEDVPEEVKGETTLATPDQTKKLDTVATDTRPVKEDKTTKKSKV